MTPPADDAARWALALRAATTTSLVGSAVGSLLHHLAGMAASTVLVLAAVTALGVGAMLPPAAPAFLRRRAT